MMRLLSIPTHAQRQPNNNLSLALVLDLLGLLLFHYDDDDGLILRDYDYDDYDFFYVCDKSTEVMMAVARFTIYDLS